MFKEEVGNFFIFNLNYNRFYSLLLRKNKISNTFIDHELIKTIVWLSNL